jgi:RNA polymerase sigma factor (sigma-70 family)
MASLTELIAAAQKGDGEAYGRIVERFQDMAYYTAYRYLGEQQPAQDAAQDAFIEAYRCLPSLESPLALTAWFRRIIFKQCDRQARSRQPLHLDDDTWLALATDRPGPDQMLEQMQQRQAVRTAVQNLPEIYQQVTQRFYLHGRSMADIALDLDLPLSTIKKRLYTARQLLKERVKPMSAPTYHPSQDDTFSNRIRFFIALKHNDLTQAGQLVRRNPALLTVETEWGVASDGWYWPLGSTALHWAAGTGNLPLTTLLVEAGADVNNLDRSGNTPLKRAVHMGQLETARWLLANGADANVAASNGQTALHAAVIRNWPEMVDLLLAQGAATAVSDSNGRTPLDWAVAKNLPALARKLSDSADLTWPDPPTPAATTTIWETGIKLLDLLAPLRWGGRNGLFSPLSGVGVDVMLGELIHCLATHYDGVTVQLGLGHGDFTAESRALQWRNLGVADHVELFFGDEKDSPARRRHLVQQGVKRALELAQAQPVLLLVYTHLALSDGVMALLDETNEVSNITTLFAGIESVGAEPPALADLDAAFTFDRQRAIQALWPAVDPIRSYAARFENDAHKELANQAARLCKRYLDLQPIYQNQGLAGFDMPLYGDAERQAVIRARLLHHFLSQPLVVAESWSAVPGQYVPLAETMRTTQAILAGAMDDAPEEEWTRLGHWSPKWT